MNKLTKIFTLAGLALCTLLKATEAHTDFLKDQRAHSFIVKPHPDKPDHHLSFVVKIPENFKFAYSTAGTGHTLTEYIPIEENLNNWSHIISILHICHSEQEMEMALISEKLRREANRSEKSTLEFIKSKSVSIGLLKGEGLAHFPQETSKIIPGKRTISQVKAVKSKVGTSMFLVEYIIRYPDHLPEQDVSNLSTQIDGFMNSCEVHEKQNGLIL